MCGIGGVFNHPVNAPDSTAGVAMSILAIEMESRGNHSWGCTDGDTLERHIGPITSGFSVPKPFPQNFALHTRWATTGKVKSSNSHPFVVNGNHRVVGMHNGIVSNHWQLNRKYNRNCRVDSQHIFEHLAADKSSDDIEAYGTIVYLKGGTWYIGTFNHGDLSVAKTKYGIFFASTRLALDKALRFAGVEGTLIPTQDNVIYEVTDSGLIPAYSVDLGYSSSYSWQDFQWENDWCQRCGNYFGKDDEGLLCEKCRGSLAGRYSEAFTDRYGPSNVEYVRPKPRPLLTGPVEKKDKCMFCPNYLAPEEKVLCNTCLTRVENKYGHVTQVEGFSLEEVPAGFAIHCVDCSRRIPTGETVAAYTDYFVCNGCLNERQHDREFAKRMMDGSFD